MKVLFGMWRLEEARGRHVSVQTFALLVNDSEYSQSADAKPILSPSCIYLVSPGARCCCCDSCVCLLLLLCASTPPRPPFWGREVLQKENRL
jgi:hypothetical protein